MRNYATQLLGALNWTENKVQIFLNNGTYLRYDMTANKVEDGYPKPINNQTWPGLQPYAKRLAGMVNWDNDKAYIFLDNNLYLRYDIPNDRVDKGYPKPISDANWPGISHILNTRRMP